jgi:thiamine biosynthesis lipoprotein
MLLDFFASENGLQVKVRLAEIRGREARRREDRRSAARWTRILCGGWCLLAIPAAGEPEGARVVRELHLMGTVLTLDIESSARGAALQGSELALRALEGTQARLSTWTADSELSRLNRQPPGEPMQLSPELAHDLERAKGCWRATEGAFDPAIGALVRAWNLRGGGAVPTSDERRAALATGGLQALTLQGGQATRRNEGLLIEEGAFGKGVGLDAATRALRRSGVRRAVIELGGQLVVFGGPGPFSLEVADPGERGSSVLSVSIDAGSISTSGNSERGIVVDGVEHGHLLDPRNGTPVPDFGSLSVWSSDATTADCLATGLYVMGPDEALEWAARQDDVEVLVLQRNDSEPLRARFTAGFVGRVTSLAPDIRLEPFVPAVADGAALTDDSEYDLQSQSTLR